MTGSLRLGMLWLLLGMMAAPEHAMAQRRKNATQGAQPAKAREQPKPAKPSPDSSRKPAAVKAGEPAVPATGTRPSPASQSNSQGTDSGGGTVKTAAQPSTAVPARKYIGLSAELGYEATYGNGAVLHLYPASFLEINGGVGYNSTGLKAGGGGGLLIWFGKSFGLLAGAAYVYSQGSSGTVSLDATFSPEGNATKEKIKASKGYKVSAAQMAGAWLGFTLGLSDSIRVDVKGCYNKVMAGNQVTFDDKIQYSKEISPTNEDAFNRQFDDQADDLVQAGGPGVAIGLQFLL